MSIPFILMSVFNEKFDFPRSLCLSHIQVEVIYIMDLYKNYSLLYLKQGFVAIVFPININVGQFQFDASLLNKILEKNHLLMHIIASPLRWNFVADCRTQSRRMTFIPSSFVMSCDPFKPMHSQSTCTSKSSAL